MVRQDFALEYSVRCGVSDFAHDPFVARVRACGSRVKRWRNPYSVSPIDLHCPRPRAWTRALLYKIIIKCQQHPACDRKNDIVIPVLLYLLSFCLSQIYYVSQ